ncbi:MAG: hypothetical protein ACRDKL_03095, partial [Solirubrobacteraceae bacterium]
MADPRIYRALMVVVALAVVVFAFSLGRPAGRLAATPAPGQTIGPLTSTVRYMATHYPGRVPGSAADAGAAGYVRSGLTADGFHVWSERFGARTTQGS